MPGDDGEERPRAGRLRRAATTTRRLAASTASTCVQQRVTGLSAEAAFFAILSLPPLVFGLAGAVGFVVRRLDVAAVESFRDQVVELAGHALTEDAVSTVIVPTVDEVLFGGRFEIISLGFLIALWSGSRALNVLVDGITIMYGLAGRRGLLRTRALSFVLYLVFLLVGIVVMPLILAGPGHVDALLRPLGLATLGRLYWPIVLVATVAFVTTLYHLAVPVRTRWRADLPGAALTLLLWVAGSVLLRLALSASAGSTSIYGPLAAPIAVLLWLYLITTTLLIGAAFNVAVDQLWPRLSGLPTPRRPRHPYHRPPPADVRLRLPLDGSGQMLDKVLNN